MIEIGGMEAHLMLAELGTERLVATEGVHLLLSTRWSRMFAARDEMSFHASPVDGDVLRRAVFGFMY